MLILCNNYVHMEQSSEVILFQRMVTQMMYQFEDNSQNFESIADSYHEYKVNHMQLLDQVTQNTRWVSFHLSQRQKDVLGR